MNRGKLIISGTALAFGAWLVFGRHAGASGIDMGAAAGPPGSDFDPVVTPESPIGEPPIGPKLSDGETHDAYDMAQDVLHDLQAKGTGYDRVLMASFQRLLRLTVDGLYGGRSAGALAWALGPGNEGLAPAPLFSPWTPVTYEPPS
jgi:hypothetical protein